MRTSEIRHRTITHTVARQYDVFISYHRNDSTRASQFARELESRGVRAWMDKLNLAPGDLWQTEIANVLEHARSVAVLIGPNGLGGWQELELQMVLAEQTERRRRIVPVPLPGAPRALTLPDLLAPFMHCDLRAESPAQQLDMLAELVVSERERTHDAPQIADPPPSWLSTLFRVAGKSLAKQAPAEPVQPTAARSATWPNERSARVERLPAAAQASSQWEFTGQELDDLLQELESGTPTHSARDSRIEPARGSGTQKRQVWAIGPTGSIKSITTEHEAPEQAGEPEPPCRPAR